MLVLQDGKPQHSRKSNIEPQHTLSPFIQHDMFQTQFVVDTDTPGLLSLSLWRAGMLCFFLWVTIKQSQDTPSIWHVIVKYVYVNNGNYNDLGELIRIDING